MSELRVHRLLPEFSAIIEKLKSGIEVPNDLTEIEIDQLSELNQLDVIYTPPTKHVDLCNYLELSGWGNDYVNGQLDNITVEIIDKHPDPFWAESLSKSLEAYDVIKSSAKLRIYITDLETRFDTVEYPALIVTAGSYKLSIGPLLTNQNPVERLNTLLNDARGGFAEVDFQESLPPHLKETEAAVLNHEILMVLIKMGNHAAASGTVYWNLNSMKRSVWKN